MNHTQLSAISRTSRAAPTIQRGRSEVLEEAERTKHERLFAELWRIANGPELVAQYRFDPERRWRSDFAHLPSRTLIETHGGTFSNGGHNRGAGFSRDREKMFAAWCQGWSVIELVAPQINAVTVHRIIERIERK